MGPCSPSLFHADGYLLSGTGIRLYGRSGLNTLGFLNLQLDEGSQEVIQFNGTTLHDTVYPNEYMEDGDHQLLVKVYLTNGSFLMGNLECGCLLHSVSITMG